MSTTRTFNAMLNDFLTYDLLMSEFEKRDYIFTALEKDNSWKGGSLIVPFEGAAASSLSFGSLTSESDISEYSYVRGEISSYKEAWGSLLFRERDLVEHDGKVNEDSFLKILPGQVTRFLDNMKFMVGINLLSGAAFAKLTADAGAAGTGILTVDRIERFSIGMKLQVDDDNSAAETRYVTAINVNSKQVSTSSTKGGSADAFAIGHTTAQNAKCYFDNAQSNSFTSLRGSLLSAANGGETTLYGQTKTAYPYLQSWNVDGSSIDATNILDKVFDAVVDVRRFTPGMPTEVWMSYKHWGAILKLLEATRGGYRSQNPKDGKAISYGWSEIEIEGIKGKLKLVAMQEMDDDVIFLMDPTAAKICSNGFFRKAVDPDGNQYHKLRAVSGYSYICDIAFYGELVLHAPQKCGILYGISY